MKKILTGLVLSTVSVAGFVSTTPVVAREIGEVEVHNSANHSMVSGNVVQSSHTRRGRQGTRSLNSSGSTQSVTTVNNKRQEDRRNDRRSDHGLEIEIHHSLNHR